ncbi:MAG: GPW/gp25 family protein, partial [Chromatiales bacterium]|nr:GPW/gp25 family protein [Chromatiales bacterium]
DRPAHVRQQIEQVLFTQAGERIFRPEFGAGVHGLVFEPNTPDLAEMVKKRLFASLSQALAGQVDPATLAVELDMGNEQLTIRISYTLASMGVRETQDFTIGPGGDHGQVE